MAIRYSYIFLVIIALNGPSASIFCKKRKLALEDKVAIGLLCCEVLLTNILCKNYSKKDELKPAIDKK